MIKIYTDGACSGNPGPGGWGFVIFNDKDPIERYGGESETTNNRMEMMAVIEALKILDSDGPVQLYTDSQYVKNGINDWINSWKRNGWKTAAKKPVKNKDLWLEIDRLVEEHAIEWRWVKGHAGDPGNERADELARMGAAAAH